VLLGRNDNKVLTTHKNKIWSEGAEANKTNDKTNLSKEEEDLTYAVAKTGDINSVKASITLSHRYHYHIGLRSWTLKS